MKRFSAAQNAMFLTFAAIFQKIVAFVYFTIVARLLGVEDVGKYVFALTFTTIFAVFIDLGLSPVLNREVARDQSKAQQYLHATLSIKILLGLLVYVTVFIGVNLLGYEQEIRYLVYLSGFTMLFDSLHLSFYAVFRGFQNLRFESFAIVGSQLTTLILGSTALFLKLPLIFLIAAFTVPSFLNACYAGFFLKRKYKIKLFPRRIDKSAIKFLGGIAWVFALAGIFSRLYSYFDTVLLSKIIGTDAVGIYSIPNKIAFAFQFIPLSLTASIYPAMSRYFIESRAKVAEIFEYSMFYLILVALPIAAGLFILGPEIITTIYGDKFIQSIMPLKILMGSMIFAFLGFPIGVMLNACNKQKIQTLLMGLTVVLNIILNLILIPKFGVAGAAISAVCGNAFLMISGMLQIPKIAKIRFGFLFKSLLFTLVATLVMVFIVDNAKSNMHWILTMPLGAGVYVAMLLVFRVVKKEHWKKFRSIRV